MRHAFACLALVGCGSVPPQRAEPPIAAMHWWFAAQAERTAPGSAMDVIAALGCGDLPTPAAQGRCAQDAVALYERTLLARRGTERL